MPPPHHNNTLPLFVILLFLVHCIDDDHDDDDDNDHDLYRNTAAEMRAVIHMTEMFKSKSSQLEITTAENEDLTSRWVGNDDITHHYPSD